MHPVLVFLLCFTVSFCLATRLGDERIVFQTEFGDLELALYPEAAPLTAAHILTLAKLGCYNSNHFFRVDRGFVAQTADVIGGRTLPLSPQQQEEAQKRVPLEVLPSVKHDKRGLLSMARYDDPNSGTSSFSITLGAAPHLDMQYTIFGEVTAGLPTLARFEELPTTRSGIFVMPAERVGINSTYVYTPGTDSLGSRAAACEAELAHMRSRFEAQAKLVQLSRAQRLPR